nr:putative capsid protein [Picobirnavirus sp.]
MSRKPTNRGRKNTNNASTSEDAKTKFRNGKFDKPKKPTNDPKWYGQSPELIRDAASIPFSWPSGSNLGSDTFIGRNTNPGAIALDLTPTVGYSGSEYSPINVAASAIYTFVRHANSGHSNYDAPDLMIYLLAMSNIYSFLTWCQRILGIVSLYDQRNRYTPRTLFKLNTVDPDSISNNIAKFRYWLNTYITKVASLVVPSVMPVFQRMAFIYSNVYIDGPTIKDQFYMYTPHNLAWYKFSLDTDDRGQLTLEAMPKAGTYATVEEIMAYGEDLFNAIWQQEDFGIMSGDILKAYGANIIKLSPIAPDFQLMPIYDTMVLHQMKNAKFMTYIIPSGITQTAQGVIMHHLLIDTTAANINQVAQGKILLMDSILTSDFPEPTPDVVIESTRLMPGFRTPGSDPVGGTEIMTNIKVAQFGNDYTADDPFTISLGNFVFDTNGSVAIVDVMDAFARSGIFKAFKYAPEIVALQITGTNVVKGQRLWDIDNYAILSNQDLIHMHEAALLSLFAVPSIAKIS